MTLASLKTHKIFIGLAFACLLPALICGLQSPFPQNDDSLYLWSIKRLCSTGQFDFLATSPSCYLPIALGALIWKCIGPSFDTLHLLSLAFSFATGAALYQILRELSLKKSDAALAAALIWINPIIANLSVCYMTDLPALAFSSWCLYFCLRALKSASKRDWIACLITLSLSLLCRQTGIFTLFALLLLSIVLVFRKRRDGVFLAALISIPALVYVLAEQYALNHTIYLHPLLLYKSRLAESASWLASNGMDGVRFALLSTAKVCCYTGFYLFPLTLPAVLAILFKRRGFSLLGIACLGATLLTAMPLVVELLVKHLMPYSYSIIFPPYVGNFNIFLCTGLDLQWDQSRLFWLTAFCDLVAFLLSILFWFNVELSCFSLPKSRPDSHSWTRNAFFLVALFVLAANLGLLILQSRVVNFDRYQMVLLVPLIIICVFYWRFIRLNLALRILAYALAGLMFVYSNLALIDHTNANRCRWELIHELESSGTDPLQVDGGPEHNILLNPDLFAREQMNNKEFIDVWDDEDRGGTEQALHRWWPVTGCQYIISNQYFPGYRIFKKRQYYSIMNGCWKNLVVLRRE